MRSEEKEKIKEKTNDTEEEKISDTEQAADESLDAENLDNETSGFGETAKDGEADSTDGTAEDDGAYSTDETAEDCGDDCADEYKNESEDGFHSEEGIGSKEANNKASKPDKKDEKIAELNDKYLRLFAEFDNFRKRSELEKAGMFTEGEKTVLLKVLPLIDNFERALDFLSDEERESAFAKGIEKVYKAFTDQLTELGVTHIEAVGKEFDANLHNAVMHVEDENEKENIVIEELQKGYMFGEKVLRYSLVKVAN